MSTATSAPASLEVAGVDVDLFHPRCASPSGEHATPREIGRIAAGISAQFPQYESATVEAPVVAEFGRRSNAPVQDFVPVFVEHTLKERLRAHGQVEIQAHRD